MILLLKLLFGQFLKAAGEFLAFCVKHWRIILPCLMVGLTYLYILHVQAQRDDARQELAEHIQADQKAADKRARENLAKDATTQRNFNALMANHTAVLLQLRNQNEKSQGKISALQSTNADLQRDINNWRQRVRIELANNVARLSGLPSATGQPAESGGECDPAAPGSAYQTLNLACSITTADYNALREAWDTACKIYGCKPQEGSPMVK